MVKGTRANEKEEKMQVDERWGIKQSSSWERRKAA